MAARSKFLANLREQAYLKKRTGRQTKISDNCESPCPSLNADETHQFHEFCQNLEQHEPTLPRMYSNGRKKSSSGGRSEAINACEKLPERKSKSLNHNSRPKRANKGSSSDEPAVKTVSDSDITRTASHEAIPRNNDKYLSETAATPHALIEPKADALIGNVDDKDCTSTETITLPLLEDVPRSNDECLSETAATPHALVEPKEVHALTDNGGDKDCTSTATITLPLLEDVPRSNDEYLSETAATPHALFEPKADALIGNVDDKDCTRTETITLPLLEDVPRSNDECLSGTAATPHALVEPNEVHALTDNVLEEAPVTLPLMPECSRSFSHKGGLIKGMEGPKSSDQDKTVSEKCAATPMSVPLLHFSSPTNGKEPVSVIAVIPHLLAQTEEIVTLNIGGKDLNKELQTFSDEQPPVSAVKYMDRGTSIIVNAEMEENLNESAGISNTAESNLEAASFTTPSVAGTSSIPARQLKAGVIKSKENETNITPPMSSEACDSNQRSLPKKTIRELFPRADSDVNEHTGGSENGQWVTFNVINGDVIPLEPDPADDLLLFPQSEDNLQVTDIALERPPDEVNPEHADTVLEEAGENEGRIIHEDSEGEENNDDDEYDHGDNGTRKRKRNVSSWKRNVAKKALDSGEEHINTKGKLSRARVMGPGCHENLCRFKCQEKFRNLPNARMLIFKQYWGLQNHTRQWDFLNKHTSVVPTKGNEEEHGKKRQISRKFFFRLNGQMVRVCRQMFLSTLDISETLVKTAHRKLGLGHTISPDKRGKNSKVNPAEVLKTESFIRHHIKMFKSVPSHLCRSRTQRKYLDSNLSVQKMYRMYVEWMSKANPAEKLCSFSKYNQYFSNNFNLGFHQPKKDLCEECSVFNNAAPDAKRQLQTDHDAHLAKKDDARKLRNEDKAVAKDNEKICFAVFDLQKTMLIPKCDIGPVYYLRKISTYNLTVVEGKLRTGFCYVWNETEGMKGANEVASAVFNFMVRMVNEQKVVEFRLWSDNCSGQNKNKYLFAMYTYFSAKFNVTIYHRYLTTGHTQNDCDSLHSIIERSCGPMTFFVPDQWYAHIESATNGGKLKTVVIKMRDRIMDFHNLANEKQHWTYKKNVNWKKICEVKVDPTAEGCVSVKHSFSDEYTTINITKKPTKRGRPFKVTSYCLSPAYKDPLPLKAPKIKDLAKMCERLIIPQEYHGFYTNIDGFPALNIALLPNLEADAGEAGDVSDNEDLADPSDWEAGDQISDVEEQ